MPTRSRIRTTPLALLVALALGGCKSPEQRACENKQRVEDEVLASYGKDLGDKSMAEAVADCVDTLARLRADTKANDEVWTGYLACLTKATTNGQLEECLGPVTQHMAKELRKDLDARLQAGAVAPAAGDSEPPTQDAKDSPAPSRSKSKLY